MFKKDTHTLHTGRYNQLEEKERKKHECAHGTTTSSSRSSIWRRLRSPSLQPGEIKQGKNERKAEIKLKLELMSTLFI